jgi:protocatechuate 3,4-dioxygenase beta subunit
MTTNLLRRREALLTIGAGLGAAYSLRGLIHPGAAESANCLLQREVTEGPYYLDLNLVRRNIRSGRSGTALSLRFKVVDASTCKPISGAAVELWHADAKGVYSGVSGNSGNFLRGIQKTNASGIARFETIYPGWYGGRTPHIHMKVFVGGNEIHTGQVFFRQSTNRAVYTQGAYRSRGVNDTTNSSDNIYSGAGSRALLTVSRKAGLISKGLNGSMVIGVNPS